MNRYQNFKAYITQPSMLFLFAVLAAFFAYGLYDWQEGGKWFCLLSALLCAFVLLKAWFRRKGQ